MLCAMVTPRRLYPIAIGAWLLIASGCSRAVHDDGAFGVLRLLEHVADARYDAQEEPDRELPIDDSAWRPFVGAQGTDAELAALVAASSVGEDGTLALGAPRGGFVQAVDHGEARRVEVLARVGGDVKLGVFELSAALPADVLDPFAFVAEHLVAHHPLASDEGGVHRVAFDPVRACAALAVAASCEEGRSGRVEELTVLAAGFRARVRAALSSGVEELAGLPPIGRTYVGFDDRPCFALPPGGELRFLVHGAGSRLEWAAALVPHAASGEPAAGRLLVEAEGDAPHRTELASQERSVARWHDAVLQTAPRQGDREVRFRFEATQGAPIALVAAPRLVQPPRSRADAPPSVVFVSIDTLRSDHLGCYGYPRPTSPELDALAARSILFEDVWAQGAYTLPTHMSLMTGQFGSVHGVTDVPDVLSAERSGLLARWLADEGFETAAFTGAGYVSPEFGFAEGFDRFSVIDPVWNRESTRAERIFELSELHSRELAERMSIGTVADWVDGHADVPFFLFVHTYAPHEFDPPLADRQALGVQGGDLSGDPVSMAWISSRATKPPGPLTEAERARLVDLYDAAIHQADRAVGELLDRLDRAGVTEHTVVAVTSDHGKELGERGDVEHGATLYEELLQVPLILHVPGEIPRRVTEPAMQVDLVPTLARLVGFEPDRPIQGRDLLSLDGDRVLYSELDWEVVRFAWRRDGLKTIWTAPGKGWPDRDADGEETYDLVADPGERDPLPAGEARVTELLAFRDAWYALAAETGGASGPRTLSAETREALRMLGYDLTER